MRSCLRSFNGKRKLCNSRLARWTHLCQAALLVVIILASSVQAYDYDPDLIKVTYTPLSDKTYPAKGPYFRLLEDHELAVHKRPYEVIGRVLVEADMKDGITWKELEHHTGEYCKKLGADSLINLTSNQMKDEEAEDKPKPAEPDNTLMRLESELIVYLDKDIYGHMGLWYDNRLKRIGGIKVVLIIKGSPAEEAGIRPGDIIKAIRGEDIGAINILTQEDYRRAQYKLRAGKTYKLYLQRGAGHLMVTVHPRTSDEVYDWEQEYGGVE